MPSSRLHKPALAAFLVVSLAASLAACGGSSASDYAIQPTGDLPDVEHLALADAPAAPDVVDAINLAGTALLAQGEPDSNVLVSPASLAFAFGMLAEGASGTAEAEFTTFFGATGDERTQALNALATALSEYSVDLETFDPDQPPEQPAIHVANNVVLDNELEAHDRYLVRLHQWYDATISTLDLATDAAKDYLDEWVRTNTAGLIEESAIVPAEDLRLVLQDAVLFAASWATEFDANDTFDAAFTTPFGEVAVPTMHNQLTARYGEADGWTGIALPYTDGFTASVLLPPVDLDLASINELAPPLTSDDLQVVTEVNLALPRFDIAATLDLTQALPELGVSAVFNDPSALSGISDQELVVSQASQQVKLRVAERGTVAAAVTEIGLAETAAPPTELIEFNVDRPFLFTITHDATGLNLITALIRDPRF
jgi:serine protease inhibitor